MVNGSSASGERRGKPRQPAHHAPVLGAAKLNPFGDLHTLQHLSARLARGLRGVFEPLLRKEIRTWAEPLVVQRFADYRAERHDGLTAWLPLQIAPGGGVGLAVIDGKFVLELLDLFFGGTGTTPAEIPGEFSPAAEAMVARIGAMLVEPLGSAWEPLTRLSFMPAHVEANASMLGVDGDDPMVVTRFGIGGAHSRPVFVDILYPVTALKPHAPTLTGKVVGRGAAPDPAWRNRLTRAAMGVKFPVRSVLAEPVIPLSRLLELKVGDVIPISFANDVPVMVNRDRLGTGTVGTANGHAAIRLNTLATMDEEEQR